MVTKLDNILGNLKVVNSISEPDRIFETAGNQPILILCDDFNHYVCKYNRWSGHTAGNLIREFIAGSFAKLWYLAIPDFLLVNVRKSHIEGTDLLQPSFFDNLCFGSKYSRQYVEIDEFYSEINKSERNKFPFREEYLKIALFDIWMGNEDRNHNNYNLLIDVENKNRFIPIDHDAVFNTGNLGYGMVLITSDDSLISTEITRNLFNKKELTDGYLVKKLKDDYYLCIENCKKNLHKILDQIPIEWRLDYHEIDALLKTHLFNNKWSDVCFRHFLELLHLQFNS